jgi:hypothetical protein
LARSFLYFAWSFLISGCARCMAIIDLACLAVSGNITSITRMVSRMMDTPRFGMMP